MIIETIIRSVGCDDCTRNTESYNSADDVHFNLPSATKIREAEDFHRVKRNGKMVDLCPVCYAAYLETLGGEK